MIKKIATIVMAVSFAASLSACGSSSDTKTSAPAAASDNGSAAAAQEIKVTASNFKFDQPEYHLKKGQTYKIVLVDKEGNHGLQVKDLGIDIKSNNGSKTITPDKTGTFDAMCDVMCGSGHGDMKTKFIVE